MRTISGKATVFASVAAMALLAGCTVHPVTHIDMAPVKTIGIAYGLDTEIRSAYVGMTVFNNDVDFSDISDWHLENTYFNTMRQALGLKYQLITATVSAGTPVTHSLLPGLPGSEVRDIGDTSQILSKLPHADIWILLHSVSTNKNDPLNGTTTFDVKRIYRAIASTVPRATINGTLTAFNGSSFERVGGAWLQAPDADCPPSQDPLLAALSVKQTGCGPSMDLSYDFDVRHWHDLPPGKRNELKLYFASMLEKSLAYSVPKLLSEQ